MKYIKGKNKYIATGHAKEYSYPGSDKQILPRIWDPSNDQGHASFYINWLGLEQKQNADGRQQYIPTYADNMEWFITYQTGLMYWRYFMWNFGGKQNDVQGLGNVRDGNWISGIPFIDNNRLGEQDKIPDSIKHNKANNKLFMIPFILGIVGFVYQFLRNKRDWIVSFLLFFLTGMAVVLYLNQPGNQPRERDYAYVGSFYAFAIWIGLAVVAFVKMAQDKTDKKGFNNMLVYGSVLTFLVTLMSCLPARTLGGIVTTTFGITALFALSTAAITYLVRAVSSGGQNQRTMNIAATIICLIAPLLMAQQEWNDHDRSQKTTAPDLAKDYLQSCEKNAILFTFGDNDTYPLWYAQEVEGVRPDIRIINYSLLGIDWYINQLRYKVNQSDSIDVIWSPEQMEGGKRDFVVYSPRQGGEDNKYYPLIELMRDYIGSDDPRKMDNTRGEPLNSFPITKVFVPVDRSTVIANKTVNANDSIVDMMRFELPKKSLLKNDLAILNILAANNWKRPIYFTSPFDNLGFGSYLRKDGMTFRLVPIVTKSPQQNWVFETAIAEQEKKYGSFAARQIWDNNDDFMYKNLMEHFVFGGANKRGIYFDEENRRHLLNIRSVFGEAAGNLADEGRKDEAQKLLDKAEAGMSPENVPYGMTSRYNNHNQTGLVYLEACYKAGKADLAEKVRLGVRKDMEQQQKYYDYLRTEKPELFTGSMTQEATLNSIMLEVLDAIEQKYAPEKAKKPAVENQNQPIQNQIKPDSLANKIDTPKKPGG